MKKKFCFFVLFLLSVSLAAIHLYGAEPISVCQVEYARDGLKVDADTAPLGTLLRAIQEKTGIEFVVAGEQLKGTVSMQLGPLPVEEVVKRVLSNFNYSFVLSADNRLMKVIVIGTTGLSGSPNTAGVGHTTVESAERQGGVRGVREMPKPSAEGDGQKLPEGMVVFSGEKKDSGSSSGNESRADPTAAAPMVIQPATEKMVVQPGAGGAVAQPAGETKMVVAPPTQPMVIQLPSGETISVKEPKKDLPLNPSK
jgi:hypothetical protein